MRESEIEAYLRWHVAALGGKDYKFTSPGCNGVSDRVVCLPNGATWFIELKTKGGRISALQKLFGADMKRLNQNYAVLCTKEQIDEWVTTISERSR